MQELFGEAEELEDNEDMAEAEVVDAHEPADPAWLQSVAAAEILVERSRVLFDSMHDEDREEAVNLIEAVEDARASHDATELDKAAAALRELLYFVGGK
jgi:hypothetical protein